MRIDIILESDKSENEVIELGQLAERYGLGAVWMPNKLDGRDPFMSFALLAKSTSKIKMGPIAISPFELHPIKMATSLLTLNELSDGRACIVVGGGGGSVEAMGLKPERRIAAVKECVEILNIAAKGEVVNYEGEIYTARRFEPTWVKATPSPMIYVGANKGSMLKMAARSADGIMMSDIPLPLMEELANVAYDTVEEEGKSKADFPINNFFAWHVYADKEAARREARRWLVLRGMLFPQYLKPFLSPEDVELVRSNMGAFFKAWRNNTHIIEGVPDEVVNKLVDGLTLWGDFDDLDGIIDELKQFEKLGLTEIALRLYQDPAASIKLIGEKVVPALS